jgi:hypothetical protein
LNNDAANCLAASRLVLLDASYDFDHDYLGFVGGLFQDHPLELFGEAAEGGHGGGWFVVDDGEGG